jgi:hypothetical protein
MTNDLAILRQAGFFKAHTQLTNEELIDALQKRRKEYYSELFGYEYEPEPYSHITELLAQDDRKFLDIDLEADVCAGNNAYVSVIEAFATASDRHFKPASITETWVSEEGPIKVSFLSGEE